jgi:dihydrofolate synthase/folylpolyglutamate synthase
MKAKQKSQPPNTLDDWLYYLDHLHTSEIDMGLTRVGKVAQKLGLDKSLAKIILIAGTNGKGTTSRFLEAYLISQGFSVGLFNSPHLIHYNERVRINTGQLGDDIHVKAFDYIEQNRGETSLTSFEFSTLAALKIFADNPLDFVIMEVGLGGRLDSTNIVNPDISVITTIDIDHQAFLGDNREAIGFEKAGIFRADKTAVVGDFDIPQSVLKHGRELGCTLVCANSEFTLTEYEQHWCWQSETLKIDPLLPAKIPVQNVSTALATLQQLNITIDRESINAVLQTLVVEGRLQVISETPYVIVDVAHNPESASYLAGQLAKFRQQGYTKIRAVVGMLKDKDIDKALANVAGEVCDWYLVDLTGPRGAKATVLRQSLEKLGVSQISCYDCVDQGLAQAKADWKATDLIIVFGSFFTIANILPKKSKA